MRGLAALNAERFAHHSNKVFSPWDMADCAMPHVATRGRGSAPVDLVHSLQIARHTYSHLFACAL